MAVDSWLPHRFAALSERLTMRNGVVLMGGAALLLLWYTRVGVGAGGHVLHQFFITFSLSQVGMPATSSATGEGPARLRHWQSTSGGGLCIKRFSYHHLEEVYRGWVAHLVITGIFIVVCYAIRRHYSQVRGNEELDEMLWIFRSGTSPTGGRQCENEPTAFCW